MSQAFHLAQLQKIDTQLDQIQNRLSEIDQLLSSNEATRNAQATQKAAREQVDSSQRKLRQTEDAVQKHRIKMETSEAALYGGKIRNPKELQDLQLEIQSLKKLISSLEDEQLEDMIAVDQSEKILQDAKQNLAQVEGQVASQSAGLLGEQSQLMHTRERLLTERSVVLPQISAEDLNIYNRLREQKHGMAVCQVADGACEVCGSLLRPAEIQAARSPNQLVRCSGCGRILYAG